MYFLFLIVQWVVIKRRFSCVRTWSIILHLLISNLLFCNSYLLRPTRCYFATRNSKPYFGSKSERLFQLDTLSLEERKLLNPRYRGVCDFDPNEFGLQRKIFDTWRVSAESFGFEEYATSDLELLKLNEKPDKIMKLDVQSTANARFSFQDKAGRWVGLRPEITPSFVRLLLSQNSLRKPTKWFTVGKCWRYERPTIGRAREHYQWNADIFGIKSLHAEAELLLLAITALKKFDLSESLVVIRISDRRIFSLFFDKLGISASSQESLFRLVDNVNKTGLNNLKRNIQDVELTTEQSKKIVELMNARKSLRQLDDIMNELNLSKALDDIKKLIELLTIYGIEDWVEFDLTVVRGLSYYTSIVFEAFDRKNKYRAILGGGRYNGNCITKLNKDIPLVGFGFGNLIIHELLKPLRIKETNKPLIHFQTKQENVPIAVKITQSLRNRNYRVSMNIYSENEKLSDILGAAKYQRVNFLITIMNNRIDDISNNESLSKLSIILFIKRLSDGLQVLCDMNKIEEVIAHLLISK